MPRTNDGAWIINLDEYKSIWTHKIVLYVNGDNVTYFDSFKVEHILKEIKKLSEKKNITTNIYRTQTNDSVTCGHFCIQTHWYVNFLLKVKSLLDYTNLFSRNFYEKNDEIILEYFQ